MAIHGKTDTLASTPKYVARKASFTAGAGTVDTTANTISLLASNTGFNTGDAVVYNNGGGTTITGLTNDATYYVRVVGAGLVTLYDTYAHAIDVANTTGILDLSGAGAGVQSLQRTGAANPYGDHINNGAAIVFVDLTEAQQPGNRAKGIKSPGWWLYRTGTNADTSVYHHAECLVALAGNADNLPVTTGDREDAIAQDGIVITVQPADTSVVEPNTATFTVTATAAGSTLAYQWQKAESSAPTVWTNVGTDSNSYTTGVTAVAAGSGATNGDLYRVIVSAAGANSVTSATATLTVTAV